MMRALSAAALSLSGCTAGWEEDEAAAGGPADASCFSSLGAVNSGSL